MFYEKNSSLEKDLLTLVLPKEWKNKAGNKCFYIGLYRKGLKTRVIYKEIINGITTYKAHKYADIVNTLV